MKIKSILIEDAQEEFIKSQSRHFNLSKFVREELNNYIKNIEVMKNEKTIK